MIYATHTEVVNEGLCPVEQYVKEAEQPVGVGALTVRNEEASSR
jgi:hypothetical protein